MTMTENTNSTNSTCARREIDKDAPLRTKIAGGLALLACVGCCALPFLIIGGIVTGAGAALLQQGLIAGALGLAVLALGMWWLSRRRKAKLRAAAGVTDCGDGGCAC